MTLMSPVCCKQKHQIFVALPLLFLALISTQAWLSFGAEVEVNFDKPGDIATPGVRVVTEEELSSKTGENGGDVWVSAMGEVFDVSTGRNHYAAGTSYGVFAGRESSASFITGDFSDEGGKKPLHELQPSQLKGVDSWRKFYHQHETYSFVGVLEGYFYDKDGKPTSNLKKIIEQMASAKMKRGEKKKKDAEENKEL